MRIAALAVLALVVMVATACGSTPNTPAASSTAGSTPAAVPATAAVSIKDFAFKPSTVTVKVGQSVTWTHDDSVPHTVTSDAADWDSGNLSKGKTFGHTFEKAGTFTYHCAIHSTMKGTVVVQ